jgi:hypothetical protein
VARARILARFGHSPPPRATRGEAAKARGRHDLAVGNRMFVKEIALVGLPSVGSASFRALRGSHADPH